MRRKMANQRNSHLQNRLTVRVIKETSPKKKFVPMLMSTATPIAAKKSRGSSQELVDSRRMTIITGIRIAIALKTSEEDISCVAAALTASPAIALLVPMRFRMAATAFFSCPFSMVIVNRAVSSL
jgi:hypothetical protein